LIKGVYEKIAEDKIRITELPIGTWTMPYTTFLESLMDGTSKTGKKVTPSIRDFTSISTEVSVDITVVFPRGALHELEQTIDEYGCNGVHKILKLSTTNSATNMHMFNKDCRLHKYDSIEEIADEFYDVRLGVYNKRKEFLIKNMNHKLIRLSNRARYIHENLKGSIDLRRKKANQVTELLEGMKFDKIDDDYKYLVKMPMDSVTDENVVSIMKEKDDTQMELTVLTNTTLEQMWLGELATFKKNYMTYRQKREKIQAGQVKPAAAGKKVTKSNVLKIKKK